MTDSKTYTTILPPSGNGVRPVAVQAPFPTNRGKQLMIYEDGPDFRLIVPFPDDFRNGEGEALAMLRHAYRAYAPPQQPKRDVLKLTQPPSATPMPVSLSEKLPDVVPQRRTRTRKKQKLKAAPGYVYRGKIKGNQPDAATLGREIIRLYNDGYRRVSIADCLGIEPVEVTVIVTLIKNAYETAQRLKAAFETEVAAAPFEKVRDTLPELPLPVNEGGFFSSERGLRMATHQHRRRMLGYGKIARLVGVERERVIQLCLGDDFFDEEVAIQAAIRAIEASKTGEATS